MRRLKYIAALTTLAGLAWATLAPAAGAQLTTKVNHDQIEITLGYHGGTVSVSGESDADTDLIIKIFQYGAEEKLKRAEKVGGAIWMNTEQLSFTQTPSLYFLRSTKAPSELLPPEELKADGIGYAALAQSAVIFPAPQPQKATSLFEEFVKFKESKRLYDRSVGGIEVGPAGDGQSYTTLFDWPFQAPPGRYQVTVYAVRDGAIIESASDAVIVEEAGTVKALAEMAGERGALYGVAAIGVAVFAGFGVGMIFGKGGGAH